MSNSLEPDQAQHFVRPDLGQNHLQILSADDIGRERVGDRTVLYSKNIFEGIDFVISSYHGVI